ncbi:MAG: S9 family peptidase [Acidimicrobiia bacterium]
MDVPLPVEARSRRAHVTDAVVGPGGRAAWIAVDGRDAQCWAADPGGAPRAVAATARPHSSGNGFVSFVGDHGLALVDPAGALVLVDLASGSRRELVAGPVATGLVATVAGDAIAASFDDGVSCVVQIVDVATGDSLVVSHADFAWDPTWSPDGRTLVWHEWDLPNMPWDASRIVAYDRATAATRVVAGGDDVAVGQPRFAPDGTLGWLSDAAGWYVVTTADGPLATGAEHAPAALGPGQRSWTWVDHGRAVWCTEYDDGLVRAVRVARDGTVHAAGAGRVYALDARDGHDIAVQVLPDAPGAVVLDGRVLATSDAARPVPSARRVEWESDGERVTGLLWEPADGAGDRPLLVEVHGGPVGAAVADYSTALNAAYWTSRGWSVLQPNPRGSTGRGRAFTRALMGQWGVADVADVVHGIEAARHYQWCSPDRIVVSGGSAGGFTALLVALRHAELVRAAVVSYPVTDLAECAADTWRFESGYIDTLVGSLPESEAMYRERSPITHAPDLQVPLLVFQGADDVVVPEHQVRALVERAPGSVEYVVFEGEGHGFKDPQNVRTEMDRTEAFLTRYVLEP